jgi:hypothetical protein
MLAIWKFLGVLVLLIPTFPLLKEWAYAGFFLIMSGRSIAYHLRRCSQRIIWPVTVARPHNRILLLEPRN